MPKKEGLSLWQSILRGIAGALVFHLSCNLLFWLFSFGPSFAEIVKFALVQVVGPTVVGAFVGLLCHQCHINRSFCIAVVTMFLSLVTAFIISEYLGVQISTDSIARNMMVYLITIIVAGFVIALLIVGLIVVVHGILEKEQ